MNKPQNNTGNVFLNILSFFHSMPVYKSVNIIKKKCNETNYYRYLSDIIYTG